jgi:hypothetical protein
VAKVYLTKVQITDSTKKRKRRGCHAESVPLLASMIPTARDSKVSAPAQEFPLSWKNVSLYATYRPGLKTFA